MVQLSSSGTGGTHDDVAGSRPIDRSRSSARELAAGFEAMLLQAAFAPLAKAIGFYGDTVVGIATQSILRDGSDGAR